jgi:pSer/pThr/pTyr-binding forkhead associated (FHA) protein
MPRLVVLSEGLTGRTHELKADRTTLGRLEDNSFQVPDSSVSSHHCEILLRGNEVLIKDLDSTNGTFINNERVSEAVLKPSQILRLGQVEIRLEGDAQPGPQQRRVFDHTQVVPQGIKANELDQTVRAPVAPAFEKKSNTAARVFLVLAILAVLAGMAYLLFTVMGVGGGK